MRFIPATGPMKWRPDLQEDKITETFFTINVNHTLKDGEDSVSDEIIPERWVTGYPHPTQGTKSSLYAALNQNFDLQYISGGGISRFTSIRSLPAILHVCIQRSDASGQKNQNPVIIPETLFMDRYMESPKGSESWSRRRRIWGIKQRLSLLQTRSKQNAEFAGSAGQLPSSQENGEKGLDADDSEPMAGLDVSLAGLADDIGNRKRKSADISSVNSISAMDILPQMLASDEDHREPEPITKRLYDGLLSSLTESFVRFNEGELKELLGQEESAFLDLKQEKYRLHAVICHSGGMAAGHYWVWIRDFKKNVWIKFNDSRVEENPDIDGVLDMLNNSGDPYYVAYVRDEQKDVLVDIPIREVPPTVLPSPDGDVEMETIEGVPVQVERVAAAVPGEKVTKATLVEDSDEPPPYEVL